MIDRLLFAAACLLRFLTNLAYELELPVILLETVALILAMVAAAILAILLHLLLNPR